MTSSQLTVRINSISFSNWKDKLTIRSIKWTDYNWRMMSWGRGMLDMSKRCSRWRRGMKRWRRAISKWRSRWRRTSSRWRERKLRVQRRRGRWWFRRKPQGLERRKGLIRLWWCRIIRVQVVMLIMKERQRSSISMKKFNRKSLIMNKTHRITLIWWFKVNTLVLRMMLLQRIKSRPFSNLNSPFRTKESKKQRARSFNQDKSQPQLMILLSPRWPTKKNQNLTRTSETTKMIISILKMIRRTTSKMKNTKHHKLSSTAARKTQPFPKMIKR